MKKSTLIHMITPYNQFDHTAVISFRRYLS